ncbi:MAG: biotin--[acetyl-CoA-carboxylase] ligase [Clostridia bacterium]
MSIQNEILKVLESERGKYFSGQELAATLNVSRQAVWKGIKTLQSDGHEIIAKTNAGYALGENSDVVTPSDIATHLNFDLEIITYKTIGSTNLEAKSLLSQGKKNNFLIISDEQTNGLGRFGKSFFSPKNSVYMSWALNLESEIVNPHAITCATAVALVDSIAKLTSEKPQIKWVNDILLNGKKICGILTEGVLDFESARFKNVVIGIGINCNQNLNDFPQDIQNKVASLQLNVPRNTLIASVINNIYDNIFKNSSTVMSRYRDNSMIIGKNIIFQPDSDAVRAKVVDLNENGHLIAQKDDGTQFIISSGAIDIEGLYK